MINKKYFKIMMWRVSVTCTYVKFCRNSIATCFKNVKHHELITADYEKSRFICEINWNTPHYSSGPWDTLYHEKEKTIKI